ncbi:MAG: UvrABC system protein C [Acidimicrobiaceae bacterium]|nr:MAG: UvrABC system protein C [Acidimicrobiaceae bacterium]
MPDAPGSYQFRDSEGRILYVGKAKSLRNRLNSYFGRRDRLASRTANMLDEAATVEWIQVTNELEALMLEFSLIQEHHPRFNVDLKDDKSYPFLAVTVGDEWPRPMVTRGKRRRGVRYFGPYGHAGAIRETLDLVLRTFPARTCTDAKFREHQRLGRPCLLFHIEKCSGPCVGEITHEDYSEIVRDLLRFLDGDSDEVVARLRSEMAAAADAREFEAAARWRDRLASVLQALEKQQMVTSRNEDLDVFGLAGDELEAAAQVFYVRRGRVVGRKGFVVDRAEDLDRGQLVAEVLSAHYRDDPPRGVPREVLVPDDPEDGPLLARWLGGEREGPVTIRVPKRGDKRSLLETVTRNADEEFVRHRMKRAADHNSRARALNELQQALSLPEAPLRIECFDMSHLQGTDYVGSMVVLEDGLPNKSEYRRFRIRHVDGNDDYAAMSEVLTRRLTAFLKERALPIDERPGRFSYPPQLLLVDGGKGQLGSPSGWWPIWVWPTGSQWLPLPSSLRRCFVPVPQIRSAWIGAPKACTSSSGSGMSRTVCRRLPPLVAVPSYDRFGPGRDPRSGPGPAEATRGGLRWSACRPAGFPDDLLALTWLPDAVAEAVHAAAHQPA